MTDFFSANPLLLIFLIAALGYTLGHIRVAGLHLGSAGILLVALVFGHFGCEVPSIVQNLGLVCFVTAVGFIAGPTFVENFKGNAKAYVAVGAIIILAGGAACLLCIAVTGVSPDLAIGLLTGALTTTPGLAAGLEATGSDLVSVGYGIAYPFGVISVVVFVQLIPKLLHADMEQERKYLMSAGGTQRIRSEKLLKFDGYGLFSFSVAIVLGVLIGKITVPLPGGGGFSLGTSGGPLLAGLILGHFRSLWIFDMDIKYSTLTAMREFGLAMFLLGAGTHAGAGFVSVLMEQGAILFVYGLIMALVPMLAGYFAAVKLFRLRTLNALGAICGGMTSTPALGTLISTSGTDNVTTAYAATYPVALAVIVIMVQLLGNL